MARPRIADHLGRDAALLQGHEPLLAVADRRAVVVLAVDDQGGRVDVLDAGDRRQPPVALALLPGGAAEPELQEALRVGRTVQAGPVGDRPAGDGGREPVRGGGQPVGHEPAVAAPGHPDAAAVDVGVRGQRGVDPGQQVSGVGLAPAAGDGIGEVVPVPGRPARVGVEHEEPRVREDVERREERVAVRAVRAAVNLQDHRPRPPRLVADGLHQPAFDVGAVLRPPAQGLGRLQAEGGQPRVVERGRAALPAAVAGVDEDLGRRRRAGHRIGHEDAVAGRRQRPEPAVAARDLADQVAGPGHLERRAGCRGLRPGTGPRPPARSRRGRRAACPSRG